MFEQWLRSQDAKRCVLIEIDADDGMIRLSDRGYVTRPNDPTLPNTLYHGVVAGGVSLSQTLPISGTASLSIGDIEIHNEDGNMEWLYNVPLHKRAIRIYYGDTRWERADFVLQVSGLIARVGTRRAGRLSIVLLDKLADLRVPIATERIGGDGPNADALRPIVLGEVHNIAAPLIAPDNYRVHDGQIERIIEARNNGAPISITDDIANGTFEVDANPGQAATITASVQGDKTGGVYRNRIGQLVELIATKYAGMPGDDIDVSAFDAAHPQPVGIFVNDTRDALDVAQELAGSVGAQVTVSRLGVLRLQKIDLPIASQIDITPDDYERGSLRPTGEPDIIAAVTIAYCRNWLVQQQLAAGLPAEHVELYHREWLTATRISEPTATTYRLPVDNPEQHTMLLRKVDAENEAQRRLDLWKVPRRVFSFVGFANLLPVEPGMGVTLYHHRHGLSGGKNGIVISAKPDWSAGRNTIEVLV